MEHTEERQAHRTRWLWLLLEGLLLLVALPIGGYHWLYRQVRPVTVWELSGSCPPPSALMKDGGEGRYAFDTDRIDWTKPADHWVLVAGRDGPRIAQVQLRDTTAPQAKGVPQVLGVDEELGPDAFLTDLVDQQLVAVGFETAPVFHKAGEWPVKIRLEDMSGNVGYVETSCVIVGAVPKVTIEAGEDVPPIDAFMSNDTMTGRFITDPATVDTTVPGVYALSLEAEGEPFETALVVRDTVPPVCDFEEVAFTKRGEALTPESLVKSARDVSALTYAFDPAPDWTQNGYQPVTVAVTDAGGNRTTGTVQVLISDLMPLTWEASRRFLTGKDVEEAQQALDGRFSGEIMVARFVPKVPGCYDILAQVDEVPCIQRLYVVDTVAPVLAFPKQLMGYLDHPQAPEMLLDLAEDETKLTYTYLVSPDWTQMGPQPVTIEAVDLGGNRTEISGTVDIVPDTEPPKIFGTSTRYVYLGEAVSYFSQVWATDNADDQEDILLTVDNSAVDIYKAGNYRVVFTATDRAGNSASRTIVLTFIRPGVSDEALDAKAEEVLASLVTDDMTLGQKAYAIYQYVKGTYSYTEKSNKRDWKYEAWRGLTTRRGDCFTYCAAAKLLLDKIGAKTMFITRYSNAHHYWLLVDLGTGWYHFDPLNDGPSRKFECFMLTTEEVLRLYPFFWRYDHKVYPDTPTSRYIRDW